MKTTSRQRQILEILLEAESGITIGEIAERLEVSSRTVHRELDAIEAILDAHDLRLSKRAGVGVCIEGEVAQREALRLALLDVTAVEYSPEERKIMILCTLLEATEPVKLLSLAIDLKVTPATIGHDLDQLEPLLAQYELTLVRRRGYGVEITGSESAKRKLMSLLISDYLEEHELIAWIRENIQNKPFRHLDTITERLMGLVEKERVVRIERVLQNIHQELPYTLADSAYIALVIHLALAVDRIEKGEPIVFDETVLGELQETREYQVAERIIEDLREMFDLEIPPAEIGYITMHLRGAKLRSSHEDLLATGNAELMAKTWQLIRLCEERMQVPLSEDATLYQGLLTHLEPALFRIRRKMKIRNPVLAQIKRQYPEAMAIVQEAVQLAFPELAVPEDEIGYLVMHIASAAERVTQDRQGYRALIVCSSGIGSSRILASRIQREIPEIESVRNISMLEAEQIPTEQYDILISTLPLPLHLPHVVVSPLPTPEDIRQVRSFLLRHKGTVQAQGTVARSRRETIARPFEALQWLGQYAHVAMELLREFRYHRLENTGYTKEAVLQHAAAWLASQGTVRAQAEVVRKLLERERQGGLGIPGTSLALFHARSSEVTRPSFTAWGLREPLVLRAMDNQEIVIDTILLLLGPVEMEKTAVEVLSEISSLLIEEETRQVLQSQEESRITDYLAWRLLLFCYRKTGLER